jgi:hypothetical protein
VAPALRKLRQKDLVCKVSLGYTVRPCLTNERERERGKQKTGINQTDSLRFERVNV